MALSVVKVISVPPLLPLCQRGSGSRYCA